MGKRTVVLLSILVLIYPTRERENHILTLSNFEPRNTVIIEVVLTKVVLGVFEVDETAFIGRYNALYNPFISTWF